MARVVCGNRLGATALSAALKVVADRVLGTRGKHSSWEVVSRKETP